MKTFPQCILVGLLVALSPVRAGQEKPVQLSVADKAGFVAVSCDTFLSSLGVNPHVDQGYDPQSYLQPLRYLGVRNIRDSQRNLPGLVMLHAQAGVRVDLLGSDVVGLTAAANTLARAGALLSIEGPNEPNNFPVTYKGQEGGGTAKSGTAVATLH